MKGLLKYKLILAGAAIGTVAGYAYYYLVGCVSGTCPITSNPVNSTIYGAIMGALLLSALKKDTTDTKHENEQR